MNLMCFLLPSVKDKPLADHHNKVCGLCYVVGEKKKKGHAELIKKREKKNPTSAVSYISLPLCPLDSCLCTVRT